MGIKTRWILAVSAGIITALPWWGATGMLLLISFVPLLLIEESTAAKGDGPLSAFPFAAVFFLGWNLVASWWIARINLPGGMSVIIVNAAIMTLIFMLFAWIKKTTGGGVVILIILWTGFEFLHHRGDLSWPWLSLGNGLASDIMMVQWYEFTGVTGGTLWVLTVNAMVFEIVRHYNKYRTFRTQYLRILIILPVVVIPPLIALNLFNSYEGRSGSSGFLVVQTALDPYENKYSGISNSQRLEKLLRLAENNITPEVDYIITPETSIDSIWLSDAGDGLKKRVSGFLDRYRDKGLLLGATTFDYVKGHEKSYVTRTDEDGRLFDVYNSAVLFAAGEPISAYHKYYLANGVEQVPFQSITGWAGKFAINMGGVSGSLKKGPGPEVIRSPLDDSLIMGTIICFESAYGEHSASLVRKGAEILVVMTNDGWFRNTGAYMQHLRLSQIRAIETRRSVIRVANMGISCHISPAGKITEELDWQEEGTLFVKAGRSSQLTFYASAGDFIGRIALFFSILLILHHFIKRHYTFL